MGFYNWRPYVPVAERKRKAEKELARMKGTGQKAMPVRIEGRRIANTFWGKSWCDHLESFSDFENRLPRGRTYVRNGSVCHLDVLRGRVNARVMGSELYTVCVDIKPLPPRAWKDIKGRCTGRISSLLDLLEGKLSAGVMEVVTDREKGLFPKPREISMHCSCPDWATMCKHVAAVLYGVGARLDTQPELLFLLRGVDHGELIDARAESAIDAVVKGGKGRRVAEGDLGAIFGVEIDAGPPTRAAKAPATPRARQVKAPAVRAARARRAITRGVAKTRPPAFPAEPIGADIKALRERLQLSRADFARRLGVSPAAVSLWERSSKPLRLQARTRTALLRAAGQPTA
jgi:uncharacterized Zn finger protein/DNA-binding transcriptional regulator YiaG